MSNFSFYYAHHMSTIEGGMICTNEEEVYQQARMFRSHGLLLLSNNKFLKNEVIKNNENLNSQFIFMYPAYNMRGTEINAIIGLNQLKRLDQNISRRNENQKQFYSLIDPKKFKKDFNFEGSSNYAFNLILKDADNYLMERLEKKLSLNEIEFRKGSAGGGNQLRQPYVKKYLKILIQEVFLIQNICTFTVCI